jgi:hypothetical protein
LEHIRCSEVPFLRTVQWQQESEISGINSKNGYNISLKITISEENKILIAVWFLIALIAFPGIPAIQYKGYYAYHTKEDCEAQRPFLENFIVDKEIGEGTPAFYIETYCLEMHAFEDQLKKYDENKQRGIGLGAEDLGI